MRLAYAVRVATLEILLGKRSADDSRNDNLVFSRGPAASYGVDRADTRVVRASRHIIDAEGRRVGPSVQCCDDGAAGLQRHIDGIAVRAR